MLREKRDLIGVHRAERAAVARWHLHLQALLSGEARVGRGRAFHAVQRRPTEEAVRSLELL